MIADLSQATARDDRTRLTSSCDHEAPVTPKGRRGFVLLLGGEDERNLDLGAIRRGKRPVFDLTLYAAGEAGVTISARRVGARHVAMLADGHTRHHTCPRGTAARLRC